MTDMNPPPAADAPEPNPVPPPIEVKAEPTRGAEGARVFDAPPAGTGSGTSSSATAGAPTRNNAWAMACHLVGLVDFGVHFMFLGLIATLVVWLVKKDDDPEVDYHGKEALNFQISLLLWWLVSLLLVCCVIGVPMLLALPFAKVVLMILGAVKAASGERWRYPFTLRLIN